MKRAAARTQESSVKDATEKSLAGERLRASESRLRAILDSEPECVKTVSVDGRLLEMNPAGLRMIDAEDSAEVLGRQLVELIHPEDRAAYLELHQKAARGGTGQLQFRIVGLRGTERWMESHSVALRAEDGGILSVLSVTRDITERKRAEAALRDSEDRYRDLVENNRDLICTHDLEGNLLSVNEAAVRFTGYSREALLRMNLADLLAPEVRSRLDGHLKTIRATGRATGLMRVLTATGETRYWEYNNSLRTEGVSLPVVRGMAQDVTEARRAKAELRASEAKHRALIDHMSEGLLLVDRGENILFANQAICRLLDYSESELVGQNIELFLFREEDRPAMAERNRRRAEGIAEGYEIELRNRSGELLWTRFSASPVADKEGQISGSMAIIADITERKRAQQAGDHALALLRATLESTADGILTIGADRRIWSYNQAFVEMWRIPAEVLATRDDDRALKWVLDQLELPELFLQRVQYLYDHPSEESFDTLDFKDGRIFERYSRPMLVEGRPVGRVWSFRDVTERMRGEALSTGQRRVLEMIAGGTPLEKTLAELLRVLEAQSPDMLCSTLLLDPDGEHLRHGAAPSLPGDYIRAIDGVAIGPCAGSCGTAAFRREQVIVEDIASDPLWQDYRALALPHGLRACWSSPIFDGQKHLLGTFAIYYRQPGRPTAQHLRLIDIATQTAAIAIGHEQNEAALRRSETQLRSFVENAPAEIAMFDNDMICLAASQRWINSYSRGRPTPVGISHYEVNPDLPERWKEGHRRALAGESQARDEDVWVQADGTQQWLRWSVDPWRDPMGAIGGIVIFVEDISARKRAQEAILAEKAFSEALLDSLPGIFFLFDQAGRFVRWNRALETISGYSPEELTELYPLDFFDGEDRARAEESLRRVFESGSADVEMELVAKDGRRIPHYFSGQRFFADGVPCCIGMGIDLTARKLLEEELYQSQKIEAIGRLAGGVAHDFNNIMGVILGYGEMAESELEPDHPVREQIAEMVKAAERAAGLTRQLQAFSRKQILQPKRLDLNDLVANTQSMLSRLIGEDIALVLRPGPGLGTVRADSGQIEQIVLNLAVNARDAMPSGGTLMLETANIDLRAESADNLPPAIPGRYVTLAVSDTGIGMDAETQRRVFEPFFTTKPVGQGTGLGLSTVYGIVKQSGGYIRVYSEPGLGTTFKIYFPRVDEMPEATTPAAPLEVVPGGHETILLVEDNLALREVIRRRLAESGYTVLMAGDGAEALALAGARTEPIDLLLTDVVMPNLGGGELARRMAALRPALRVLFMSGYTDGAIGQHGILEEGVMLLEKPFTGEKVVRAVREALDGSTAK
jgi:PAS domain S-box-containing protein